MICFLDHLYTHLRSPSILAAGSNSNQTQNSTLVKENKDVCFNLHIVFRDIKIGWMFSEKFRFFLFDQFLLDAYKSFSLQTYRKKYFVYCFNSIISYRNEYIFCNWSLLKIFWVWHVGSIMNTAYKVKLTLQIKVSHLTYSC